MRTTLNIPDELLEEILSETRGKTRTDAVVIAMEEYLRLRRKEKLLGSAGKFKLDIDLKKMRKTRGLS